LDLTRGYEIDAATAVEGGIEIGPIAKIEGVIADRRLGSDTLVVRACLFGEIPGDAG
jgi:hypothetical protein